MKYIEEYTDKFASKLKRKLFTYKKNIYQKFQKYHNYKKILFIFGCQRSGTTLILNIFEKDLNTKIYHEFSRISSQDIKKIRLNSHESVKNEIIKNNASFIIIKPLVESQNALRLLEYFEKSKSIWMYRNYKDVAASNLIKFGINNGIRDIIPIVENNCKDWRAENVSDSVRKIILQFFSHKMNPYDAAVLFWFARNSIFFDLGLEKNRSVILCKYEDLVNSPLHVVSGIYKYIGEEFPGKHIVDKVHSTSVRKGKSIKISSEVEQIANELFIKLDFTYKNMTQVSHPKAGTQPRTACSNV